MININTLKEKDIYSILLYGIYKLTSDPEYSTISELIYTLDRDSFLNLCATFGGCTVKIPTLDELKLFTSALLVYQLVNFEHKSFNDAFKSTGLDSSNKKTLMGIYDVLKEVLEQYE